MKYRCSQNCIRLLTTCPWFRAIACLNKCKATRLQLPTCIVRKLMENKWKINLNQMCS